MIGIEEGTFWDEHWVLYGNQFDNKFHKTNKKKISEAKVSYDLALSLSFFFSSPPPWSSVKFLRIHIRVKTYGICLSLYDLFHLA